MHRSARPRKVGRSARATASESLASQLASGGVTPYLYRFGYNSTHPGMGVLHGGEVDLVFQKLPPHPAPHAAGVSLAAGSYWSNFITRGAPLRPTPAAAAWPTWPQFGGVHAAVEEPEDSVGSSTGDVMGSRSASSRALEHFLEFDTEGSGRARSGGYGETCAAWETYITSSERARANFIAFGYLC